MMDIVFAFDDLVTASQMGFNLLKENAIMRRAVTGSGRIAYESAL